MSQYIMNIRILKGRFMPVFRISKKTLQELEPLN